MACELGALALALALDIGIGGISGISLSTLLRQMNLYGGCGVVWWRSYFLVRHYVFSHRPHEYPAHEYPDLFILPMSLRQDTNVNGRLTF